MEKPYHIIIVLFAVTKEESKKKMNKKTKLKLELEEQVKRVASSEDCPEPSCKQHFGNSSLMRDSHRMRYPDHFSAVEAKGSKKVEAAPVDLEPKIYRRKK